MNTSLLLVPKFPDNVQWLDNHKRKSHIICLQADWLWSIKYESAPLICSTSSPFRQPMSFFSKSKGLYCCSSKLRQNIITQTDHLEWRGKRHTAFKTIHTCFKGQCLCYQVLCSSIVASDYFLSSPQQLKLHPLPQQNIWIEIDLPNSCQSPQNGYETRSRVIVCNLYKSSITDLVLNAPLETFSYCRSEFRDATN